MTSDTETVRVFDPDGTERAFTRAEAEAMVERGEAIYCPPDEYGGFAHWHTHERWPEGEDS